MRRAAKIVLNADERQQLAQIDSATKHLRAQIVLLAADGKSNQQIADMLYISDSMASHWRNHWLAHPTLPADERLSNFTRSMWATP